MKVYNTSLIKKGILFSLFLLSPEILAAENLNFKYTRADAVSVDPRLGLQSKICHTLSDPLRIDFEFSPHMLAENYNIQLIITAKPQRNSYAMVTSDVNANPVEGSSDKAFLVPWSFEASGKSEIDYAYETTNVKWHKVQLAAYVSDNWKEYTLSDGSIKTVYTLPINTGYPGVAIAILNWANFQLNISHRNISSLELKVSVAGGVYGFLWERDSSGLTDKLNYKGKIGNPLYIHSAGNIKGDYYQSIYGKGIKKNYFRGTLVPQSLLSERYNKINEVTPLSLPAENLGDINLVNTERLKFLIGEVNSNGDYSGGYGGNFGVTVWGMPLKFAPLYVNGKEAASAMQVRNACY
ncbi:TPA: hypothetical protein G8M32_005224 [Salmonella enterica]|nr:hypothetical protein [Salmonella enterica]